MSPMENSMWLSVWNNLLACVKTWSNVTSSFSDICVNNIDNGHIYIISFITKHSLSLNLFITFQNWIIKNSYFVLKRTKLPQSESFPAYSFPNHHNIKFKVKKGIGECTADLQYFILSPLEPKKKANKKEEKKRYAQTVFSQLPFKVIIVMAIKSNSNLNWCDSFRAFY